MARVSCEAPAGKTGPGMDFKAKTDMDNKAKTRELLDQSRFIQWALTLALQRFMFSATW